MLNPIYFNADFLEFTIDNFRKLPFFKNYNFTFDLDFDNSSQGFIKIHEIWKTLSYRKVNFKNYENWLIFSISIDDIAFDIFYLAKWKVNKAKITTKDKVWFYSTFFTLDFLWKLNFTIVDFYKSLFYHKNNKIHRLDICLDVAVDVETLTNTLFKDVKFYSTLWADEKNKFFAQTYYLKNPMSSQNRFYIFRIYDKLLDTFKKWKNFLFSYLEDFENVRRIELEIRSDSAKLLLYKIEDILTNNFYCLEEIFKWYLMKKWNSNLEFLFSLEEFKNLWILSSLNVKRNVFDLKNYYATNLQIPKNYISKWHWYLKKIYSVWWFEVVFDLFFKWYNAFEKKQIERADFSYLFFENFLDYAVKHNLNINTLNIIYNKKIKNFKKPKIKLKK